MKTDEELAHIYHMGIDLIAKISLLSKDELEKLREKFKVNAVREKDWDSVACRSLANICEGYLND